MEAEQILKQKIELETHVKNQNSAIQKLCEQVGLLEDEHPNEYIAK